MKQNKHKHIDEDIITAEKNTKDRLISVVTDWQKYKAMHNVQIDPKSESTVLEIAMSVDGLTAEEVYEALQEDAHEKAVRDAMTDSYGGEIIDTAPPYVGLWKQSRKRPHHLSATMYGHDHEPERIARIRFEHIDIYK